MSEVELLPAYDFADASALAPRLVHRCVRELFAYWLSKAAAGRLPRRADLDPLEMRSALGHLAVVEVHRDPLRFRYRLHGAGLAALDGFDMTNKWLDEHPVAAARDRIASSWRRAAEHGRLIHGFRDCFADIRPRRYEVLVLPLAENGATVDKLLVMQSLVDRPTA
jgi:hypothetical protein